MHFFDARAKHQLTLEGEHLDIRPHNGRQLFTCRREGVLHLAGIKTLDGHKPVLFGNAEDDKAALRVGKCRKRLDDAFGGRALGFFYFVLLGVVSYCPQMMDDLRQPLLIHAEPPNFPTFHLTYQLST